MDKYFCGKCGAEVGSWESLADHLVKEHSYKREGANVFQSVACLLCGRPGIYKIGASAYCFNHKAAAMGECRKFNSFADAYIAEKSAAMDDSDKDMRYRDSRRKS